MFAQLKLHGTMESKDMLGANALEHKYGTQSQTSDPNAAYDDRNYERSVLRHSPYMQWVKQTRLNAEMYTRLGFFPERYNPEFPKPYGDKEIYCGAVLEICDEYKRVILECGSEITLYKNGVIVLLDVDDENPETILDTASPLENSEAPYLDYLLSRGLEPDISNYTVSVLSCDMDLSENGGCVSVNYDISKVAETYRSICFELKLCRITDENRTEESFSGSQDNCESSDTK